MDEEKSVKKLSKKAVAWISIAVIAVIVAIGAWYVNYHIPHSEAVASFNEAAEGLMQRNAELDSAIVELQEVMGSGKDPYDPSTLDAASDAIGSAQGAKQEVPEMPSDTTEIADAADEIESMGDYSVQIEALSTAQENLQRSIDQLTQVTNPSEQFVIERLTGLPNITGVEAVTEKNDPNGNLNKQGGYTATVYFSSDLVDQSEVYPSEGYTGIPAVGTEGGGAVEVYATVEDAEERDTYLAAFDGGFLSSGSHRVAGTCVIRTSYRLTASQQQELEQNIIDSLTRLD